MSKPFIPNRDADFDAWLANFAGKIAGSPAAYGLSAGDAAEITAAQSLWVAAYALAGAPATRTAVTIADKDSKRAAAVLVVRRLAALVRADSAVADSLKLGLGLRLRKHSLTRGAAPSEAPVLSIVGLDLAAHELCAWTGEEIGSRAKPHGVATLLVVRAVGDAPAKDPAHAAFLTLATRTRFQSRFNQTESGQVATYFARWANAKGELSPWSAPVSMRIAA